MSAAETEGSFVADFFLSSFSETELLIPTTALTVEDKVINLTLLHRLPGVAITWFLVVVFFPLIYECHSIQLLSVTI